MAGRHAVGSHAARRTRGSSRQVLPALAGTVMAAVLIGGAIASVDLDSPASTSGGSAWAELAGGAARAGGQAGSRADRGELREPDSAHDGNGPVTTVLTGSPAPTAVPPATTPGHGGGTPAASPAVVVATGTCKASYYATGSSTASGEPFDPDALTAAHKTLPFNTRVRVTNVANGTSVVVRVNDRGPYVAGRCLDLTRGAFKAIASLGAGVLTVRYEVLK